MIKLDMMFDFDYYVIIYFGFVVEYMGLFMVLLYVMRGFIGGLDVFFDFYMIFIVIFDSYEKMDVVMVVVWLVLMDILNYINI